MKSIRRSWLVLKQQLSSPAFVALSLFVAFLYAFLLELLFQTKIVMNIFSFSVPFSEKLRLIFLQVMGSLSALDRTELYILLVVSLLVGINIALVRKKINFIKRQKNIRFTFGAGILSVAGAGCTSCGFSVMTVFGLGGAMSFLPLKGLEFSFLAIIVLLVTMFHSLNSLAQSCKIR